ncbi:hypothetical protein EVAR_95054_1 [Eumeta japonica]|uniref:Uncharacterized protein n=1 Tax=Eumeta variegata TaxID=151549 RepID=A0A4C1W7T1_EUMVA|nr:hypothetical protein EVAR_95054_1 [Eumeta japonica]
MDELAQFPSKCDPKHARKKTSDKSTWKRSTEQRKRYESKGLPKFPNCNHNQKAFRCAKLICQDVRRLSVCDNRENHQEKEVVTSPAEYVSVLEENATVTDLSKIALYDWKKGYENIIKPTTSWNFPFMKTKRFFLTRTKSENILVQGEIHYKSEINTKSLITKNKKNRHATTRGDSSEQYFAKQRKSERCDQTA